MKQLEKVFVSGEGGFAQNPLTYKQIKRTEKVALYERSRNNKPYDYEVFYVKIQPKGSKIFNKIIEEDVERYPTTSQFGYLAWSFNNLKAAEIYYDDLNQEEKVVEKKEIIIPTGEFSVTELAKLNNINYITASNFVKDNNQIMFVKEEKRNLKGKATKIYKKIS